MSDGGLTIEVGPERAPMKRQVASGQNRRTRDGKLRLLRLEHLDARTAAAKAAQELVRGLAVELGGGDQLSAGERQLVQRAALCGAITEDFETRWVAGHPIELTEYLAAVNVQRRVLAVRSRGEMGWIVSKSARLICP